MSAPGDPGDLGERGLAVAHLGDAVLAQSAHPLLDGDGADLVGWGALDDESPDLGRHGHDLEQADATAVAGAAAARAAHGLEDLDRLLPLAVECGDGNGD